MLRHVSVQAMRQVRSLAAARHFVTVPESAVANKSVDWDALSDAIASDEGKRELAQLKKQFSDVISSLDSGSQSEGIDWGYWKKELGDEALVSSFENAFKGIKIPTYSGNEIEQAKAAFAKLEDDARAEAAASEVELKKLNAELETVRSQMAALSTMTVEEAFAKDPKMGEEIDEEIRAGDWFDASRP